MHLQYKDKFYYSISKKPFQGSKKRAKESLEKYIVKPKEFLDFIAYIENTFTNIFDKIMHIEFRDFIFYEKKKQFSYHIAMIYTKPYLVIRETLFAERDCITENTGWYPYITGIRADFKNIQSQQLRIKCKNINFHDLKCTYGKPISLVNVSSSIESSAILLECEKGSILFDTGFGINMEYIDCISVICISHFHKDHTGGLIDILKTKSITFFISELTFEYLINLPDISIDDKNLLLKNAITLESLENYRNFRKHLDFFPVYHVPGSMGFVYKYSGDISIYYFGDICLDNGFYSYKENFLNILKQDKSEKKHIIMDCAMIGKKNTEIADDTVNDIMNDIEKNLLKRNVIFVSKSPETLIYSFILNYIRTINSKENIRFIINDELFTLLRMLWKPWIEFGGEKDLFISKIMKTGLSNFIESQRLYPVSYVDQFNNNENIVYIVTVDDINNIQKKYNFIEKRDVILVGPWIIKEETPEEITKSKPRSILNVSSPNWCFHTSEYDIKNIIFDLCKLNINVELFHNYPKTLKKFIKENDFGNQINIVSKTRQLI